ncbi:collagen alpha-1(XXV) chain-like [Dendrobates tinctorius]|uniref:collagen alpha-1(XXV) chain-like n=1 Tax=Dendrobates tinctorius TaxID=92724 RepID=UPI003CC92841
MVVKGDTGNNSRGWSGAERRDGAGSCGRTVPSALAVGLALLSVASCVYLSVKSADLEGRMRALERGQSGELFTGPGLSVDQLNSIVQEKVDRLLSQRSYEHMAKIRISREAPAECNCPAGPPGQRGKRGRRGEPESASFLDDIERNISGKGVVLD